MRKLFLCVLALSTASVAVATACDSDDTVNPTATTNDAGGPEVGPTVVVDSGGFGDSAPPLRKCGDITGAPPRLLLTLNQTTTSEVAAINLSTNAVDGRLTYTSKFGTTWAKNEDPYVLAGETDVVSRLDPQQPWNVLSSWNIRGADGKDGGKENAQPVAIVVPDCKKGYVLRFNRNKIAVIDTTEAANGGAPKSYIDLSSLLDANDTDGLVEMTGALWVPAKNRIFVLLGNIDINKVALDGYTALCASSKPTIIAIDPATDTIDPIKYTLNGYNPPLGPTFAYDAKNDRFIVMSAGCNVPLDDGGPGPTIAQRRIEAIDAKTGDVTTLLSLDDQGFPTGFEYVDDSHAVVGFFGSTYFWDPQTSALGASIAGGIDYMAKASSTRIVGARATYLDDGGPGPIQVVSLPLVDGGVGDATVLTENPFTKNNSGFLGAAEVWPRP